MAHQKIPPHLNPGTCGLPYLESEDFEDVIKLKILIWGNHSGLSGWDLINDKCHKRGTKGKMWRQRHRLEWCDWPQTKESGDH